MSRINRIANAGRSRRRGMAIVPALLIVSGLAIFTMALMTATVSGNRSLVHQSDDYKISSAVETTAILAMEDLWSGYLVWLEDNNFARTITRFQEYMDILDIPDDADTYDADGDGIVELIPGPGEGKNVLPDVSLPNPAGNAQINSVNIDAVEVVRVDLRPNPAINNYDRTQVFLTVSASTTRGAQIVNPLMNRAVQQVFTVEPDEFDGFDYAMLSNNVNCIFCHTNVDSAERYFNQDPARYGSYDRVRVGTLESLLMRHDMDGNSAAYNDFDADSFIAGTIYTRGTALKNEGQVIPSWADLSLMGYLFDEEGKIVENNWGLGLTPFSPAGAPLSAGENLYLQYPVELEDQVDGAMPAYFPAPFPDDGGLDPGTGLPVPGAVANRMVDDAEYEKVAASARGAITAGVVNVTREGESITTPQEYLDAVMNGNAESIQQSVDGNVILSGTYQYPIRIDGTVAIDGDVVVQGWIAGEGSIVARGNIYIPSDLTYVDEWDADGNRTFGVNGGYRNAVGLTAGGNILIGDYQKPSNLQPDGTWVKPGKLEIITGNPDGDWSFVLSEMAIFNRGEWAKTQALLPGQGEDTHDPSTWTVVNPDNRTHPFLPGPGDDLGDPSTWSLQNTNYDPLFKPRYYGYGEDTILPLHNKANPNDPDSELYFDPDLHAWIGDEAVTYWEPDQLTYMDPSDPSDPLLYPTNGSPTPVQLDIAHEGGWIDPNIYQLAVEYFMANRGPLDKKPMMIDGLLYTNNAIFTLAERTGNYKGRMILNGALVAADIGMLVPGHPNGAWSPDNQSPLSGYSIGLQLNYDRRVKNLLNVKNPFRVELKRTLWNPTANLY